jgi:hypothetical protein
MVFARNEQNMLNSLALELINKGGEITEGVASPVIEGDPLGVQAFLLQQPSGIFPITAPTHK